MVEKEVKFGRKIRLSGTLTIPEGSGTFPSVLLLPGSGEGDRDGNLPKRHLNMNMYSDLAHFYAAIGIASLRFDKRGTGKSEGNFMSAGMKDFVQDAEDAYFFLVLQSEIDEKRTFIQGHSEGGTLAIALGAKVEPAGLILLSTAFEGVEKATEMQRKMAYYELNNQQGFKGWLIRSLHATEKAEKKNQQIFAKIKASDKDVMHFMFKPVNAKWLREHFSYDQITDLEKINCPILAITGENDIQVDAGSVAMVPSHTKAEATTYIIPGMNHILKQQQEKPSILKVLKSYKLLETKPLHPELLEKIKIWMEAHI